MCTRFVKPNILKEDFENISRSLLTKSTENKKYVLEEKNNAVRLQVNNLGDMIAY